MHIFLVGISFYRFIMDSIFTSLPVASRSIVDTTKAKGGVDMQYDFQESKFHSRMTLKNRSRCRGLLLKVLFDKFAVRSNYWSDVSEASLAGR